MNNQTMQQYRTRRNSTPRGDTNNRQQQQQLVERNNSIILVLEPRRFTITVPWSFFVSLIATIIIGVHHSYIGSTIRPAMAGSQSTAGNGDFALLNGHTVDNLPLTFVNSCTVDIFSNADTTGGTFRQYSYSSSSSKRDNGITIGCILGESTIPEETNCSDNVQF
eukprot:3525579-Amphidinium_carterae.4